MSKAELYSDSAAGLVNSHNNQDYIAQVVNGALLLAD
jgi:hypothetical protein